MNITFTQSSGLQDSIYGNAQAPIQRFIEDRGEEFEQASVVKDLFLMGTTQNYADMMTSMTAMEGFKPVGELGAYPVDGMREGFKKILEQMTWKDSFALSREMIEDAKIMDMRQQPRQFMTSYHRTRETFGAALFGSAMAGNKVIDFHGMKFDVAAADEKPLFDKAHPSVVDPAYTQSNQFSDAFSNDALGRMETAMQKFNGDNKNLLGVSPDAIVIPNDADLKNDVFAAIGADKDPVTANNAFNYQYGRWTVIIWSYLDRYVAAGKKPWMLMDSTYNNLYGGAVWNDRVQLDVRSTIDENTDANVWRGYSRFNATFNDWRAFAIGGVAGGTALKSA